MFIKLWLISVYIFLYGDVLKLGSFTGSLRVWGLCTVSNMFLGVCLCACDIFFYWQNKINAVVYKFWLVGLRWPLTIAGSDLICRHCHLSVSVLVNLDPGHPLYWLKCNYVSSKNRLSSAPHVTSPKLNCFPELQNSFFIKVGGTKNCNCVNAMHASVWGYQQPVYL